MSLFIASLNSGSNGNCYYIGNGREAILVDAGLSCRETERRMLQLGLNIRTVRGVFVSHEHTDHIRGLEQLSRKYRIPVYITQATLYNSRLNLEPSLTNLMGVRSSHDLNGLCIQAFPKTHDAVEPCSFIVRGSGVVIGVFTDIGTACSGLTEHFRQCHAAFLEANYDEEMLEKGPYPYHLKRRISGGRGHLSNRQALELFVRHRPAHMSHLLLSHLSQDNNSPEKALSYFAGYHPEVNIQVASRHAAGALIHIEATYPVTDTTSLWQGAARQMALF